MAFNPLKSVRIPRRGQQSLLTYSRDVQGSSFHSAAVLRLPNPYSKRPAQLPQPSDVPPKLPETHENHGLYGFFRGKTSVTAPHVLENHGRPWTAEELRKKSFHDLHTLWYKCLMERNIIATEAHDARRQGIFFALEGIHKERNATVKRTMSKIKFVLWERYRAWWGAHQLNEEDPLLLDRMKEMERIRKQEKWDKLPEKEKERILAKTKAEEEQRQVEAQRRLEQEEKLKQLKETDAEALERYRNIAASRASSTQ